MPTLGSLSLTRYSDLSSSHDGVLHTAAGKLSQPRKSCEGESGRERGSGCMKEEEGVAKEIMRGRVEWGGRVRLISLS